MNNIFIYRKLLDYIKDDKEAFDILVNADNSLGLSPTSDDIINFLEFSSSDKTLDGPIVGKIILTEGDVLTTLRVIHDVIFYEGEFTIHINESNVGVNTYLVKRANKIYQSYNLNITLKLDYATNYNAYLNDLVTIIGSEDFVEVAALDFKNANQIIM